VQPGRSLNRSPAKIDTYSIRQLPEASPRRPRCGPTPRRGAGTLLPEESADHAEFARLAGVIITDPPVAPLAAAVRRGARETLPGSGLTTIPMGWRTP
jgi:hypothetical protein